MNKINKMMLYASAFGVGIFCGGLTACAWSVIETTATRGDVVMSLVFGVAGLLPLIGAVVMTREILLPAEHGDIEED